MIPGRVARAGLVGAAVLGAFTPVSFQPGGGAGLATAACPTCCELAGPTCVVCGTAQCVKFENHYEGKVGTPGCASQT